MTEVILVVLVLLVGVSLIFIVGKLNAIARLQDRQEQRLRGIEAALGLQDHAWPVSLGSEAGGPPPRAALPSEEAFAQRQADRWRDEPAMSRIGALLREGKKIEAIKLYRQTTGVGLKEAKDAIDGLQRQL